ncbi:hypothetical protein GTY20_20680 [Streptomyces sp. SID4946]|nr:hypothetical protein [Streptomyces sp. SID4946]
MHGAPPPPENPRERLRRHLSAYSGDRLPDDIAALTRLPHCQGVTTGGPDEHRPVRRGRPGQNAV